MPIPWAPSAVTRGTLGRFQIIFSAPGVGKRDVTFYRNVPTQLVNYSSADPFGDSVCTIVFPQITIFDEIGQGDLAWLHDFADVDIYIVPPGAVNPNVGPDTRTKVWEGFLASYDFAANEDTTQLTVQCTGALFQVDKYVQAPSFPARPITYERLIGDAVDPHQRPHLRLQPLTITWPSGWTKVQPAGTPTIYTPTGTTPGQKITGFNTRSTGSWERSLTGYIQNMLSMMVTEAGDNWTLGKTMGRKPVLYVRQRNLTPKYSVWASQPGVQLSLTRDMTQFANLIYGQGTDVNGVEYTRQVISNNGSVTTYDPMAFDPQVYPAVSDNPRYNQHVMRVETHIKYDSDERQAITTAGISLLNYLDPGYSGTITLTLDPVGGSRYLMQAGDKIQVKYLTGSGSNGVIFHIAEVNVDVDGGTTTLKVDTKFRDLLSLEESLARTRDPLTPVKMLTLNKRSQIIADVLAPWDYSKGSGFIPEPSTNFYKNLGPGQPWPYTAQALKYPPKKNQNYYCRVPANAKTATGRWATGFPIRMAQVADIRLTQFSVFDWNGNRLAIPFHVSLYYNPTSVDHMPRGDNGQTSPFIEGAFETVDQYGQLIQLGAPGAVRQPASSLIVGWGNYDQPAGYSPGSHSSGDPVTGLLVDATSWTADLASNNPNFSHNPGGLNKETEESITIYANFYAEYKEPVFFMGRLYRKEPGT